MCGNTRRSWTCCFRGANPSLRLAGTTLLPHSACTHCVALGVASHKVGNLPKHEGDYGTVCRTNADVRMAALQNARVDVCEVMYLRQDASIARGKCATWPASE